MSKTTQNLISTLLTGPWNPSWWQSALKELRSFRIMTITALLLALRIVVSSFFIPLGENLKIYFTFFISGVGGAVFGPFWALLYGFASDILGYALHPDGAFFFGYLITSMLGAFVYALFFYRARITVLRIFLCKLCINLFINVGLGSLWSAMMFGKGYYFYLARSLVKNLLLLPVETALLALVFSLMLPILARLGLASPQPTRRLPWF